MTEILPSVEKKVQLHLQMQSSDGLKKLVGELIQPEIRRQFARRILYLVLRPQDPVEIAVNHDHVGAIDDETSKVIGEYTKNIEDIKSKTHMYNRALHLAPEIGYYKHANPDHGINLRFKLALSAVEASHLFAPPFNAVDSDRAYIVTNLPGSILGPEEERAETLNDMRRKFGVMTNKSWQHERAPDLYYVSRPTIKKRYVDPQPE